MGKPEANSMGGAKQVLDADGSGALQFKEFKAACRTEAAWLMEAEARN